ncbi:MAG: DNA repair protein RecO [Candidatus Aureabacteria bacterium]|nr:DNA repair protein RecO [Candidatus Auribacterota bacterium]
MTDTSFYRSNAIILKSEPLRSTSMRFIFHTEEFGRIIASLKGFFKNKAYITMPVSPGTEVELVFFNTRKNSMMMVKEINLLSVPRVKNFNHLASLQYFIEFMLNVTTDTLREHNAIYKLFISLKDLIVEVDDELSLLFATAYAHEIIALKILGFLSSPDECAVCGIKTPETYFLISDMSFCCRKCSQGKKNILISLEICSFISTLMKDNITPKRLRSLFSKIKLSNNQFHELQILLKHLTHGVFGHDFRSSKILSAKQ